MYALSGRTAGFVALVTLIAVIAGTAGTVAADSTLDGRPDATLATGNHSDGVSCGGSGAEWVPDSVDADTSGNDSGDVRVIVTYESDGIRSNCAGSAVSAVGGEIVGGRDVDLLPMAFARVDPAAMDALESRPGIESVERDGVIRASGFEDASTRPTDDAGEFRPDDASAGGTGSFDSGQTVPWGLQRINATAAAAEVSDSEMRSVQVAVMDSGIDLDHPDLQDNLVWGTDHINGNHRDGLEYTDDVLGHGTHVAGTIAARDNDAGVVGVAPNVELYSVRVLNGSNWGFYSWWIAALDRTVKGPDGDIGTADDPEIVSMSLGGTVDSDSLQDATRRAEEHTLLVAAAGNRGNGNPVDFPGRYAETLTVGATDKNDDVAPFSSTGDALDIAAPGTDILSTTDPDHAGGDFYQGGWQGTSMATPHVSGAAALVIAQDLADGSRDLSDAEVENKLTGTAKDINEPGTDTYSGHGRIRAAAALNVSVDDEPPTAALSVEPPSPVTNETVVLNASASTDDNGIARYDWNVGGEWRNDSDSVLTGRFVEAKSYDVTVVVTDTVGQTASATQSVTVEPDETPTASFTVAPETPATNETVTFDASASTDDDGIASYNWSIGGVQVNDTAPVERGSFAVAGTYNVTLTVFDTVGQSDSTTKQVTVEPDERPMAAFTVDPESPATNETVTLDAGLSNDDEGIVSYNWTVGDRRVNTTDPVENVSFPRAGTYNVTLTVVDGVGQTDAMTQSVSVTPDATPDASFTVTPESPITGENVTLNASASSDDNGIVRFDWAIGTERVSRSGPVHTVSLPRAGTYNVTLTVVDGVGQTDSANATVTVEDDDPPTAAFSVDPESPITNETAALNASGSTDDNGIVSYNWTVAGDRVHSTDPTTAETFPEPGEYAVRLTVVDTAGQTDSVRRSVSVTDRVMFSSLRTVSPSRVNETTPLGTDLLVRDLLPNTSVSSQLNVSVSVNGTVRTETNTTVSEGETRRLSVPVTFEETGTYNVSLDGSVTFNGTTYDAGSGPSEMVVVGENDSVSPPVVGDRDPTNLDADPTLEDVDGDGDGGVSDVMAYYQQRRSDVVRDNPGRFDFDGDGVSGTVFDAIKLYRELT